MFSLLCSNLFLKQVEDNSTGSNYPAINEKKFNKLLTAIPPLNEQKRIVKAIEEAFAQIEIIEREQEALKELSEQFKAKVLDTAMRGKLVEQDPSDESASVLLEKIKAEKIRLFEEGKIKKKDLTNTEIIRSDNDYYEKDKNGELKKIDVPYELPDGWEWCRLVNITKVYLGLTHRPKYIEKGIPFLSVKDISNGKINFDLCKYISPDKFKIMPEGSKPQKGDVLFGRVGTLGKPSIVTTNLPFGIFVSLGYLRPYLINMNTFLKRFMETNLFFKQVYINTYGVAQVNLNTGLLNNFVLPIPPLNEQKRIVSQIEDLFSYIDKLI